MFYWFAGKLIIIVNNCPPLRRSEIEYYAMLAKIGVHHFNGSKLFFLNTLMGKIRRASYILWTCNALFRVLIGMLLRAKY